MDTREAKIYLAVLIAAIVIAILLLFFVITVIRHHRIIRRLFLAKIKAEVDTLEKERQRIAGDLHDEISPAILLVKYKMDNLDTTAPADLEIAQAVNEKLDTLLQRLREISNDLLPAALLRHGFVAVMEDIAESFSKNGLAVAFVSKDVPPLPYQASLHLYRIMTEIIQNTIKHAKASLLLVELKGEGNRLLLRTKDDGIGFHPPDFTTDIKGLGLKNLLSRTEILGGKMYLDTAPSKGTHYSFEIPFLTNPHEINQPPHPDRHRG